MSTSSLDGADRRTTDSDYELRLEQFEITNRDSGRSWVFELDEDLSINVKPAQAQHGGSAAAVVLIELGIDGYDVHHARLDFGGSIPHEEGLFTYARTGDEVKALTDAIETLTVLRDELARSQARH